MEYMSTLPDGAFDFAVVDPPYGIQATSFNMGSRAFRPATKSWDAVPPTAAYFCELQRISKHQIIWGGNYFNLPPSRCFIVWDKGESMYGRSFAECEMAWTSLDEVARIIKVYPNQADRIHPTQKPVVLYEILFSRYLTKGCRVIDTHMGSASSAIAAHAAGLNYVGIEIDNDYYVKALNRVQQETRQIALYDAWG